MVDVWVKTNMNGIKWEYVPIGFTMIYHYNIGYYMVYYMVGISKG